ncbi:hypothetical protein D3C81_1077950 [compost metagenome]
MEQPQDFPLHFPVQVDEQVTAYHQVQLRERWIGQQVVPGEQHFFANVLAYAVILIFLDEELAQPGRGNIGGDGIGVNAQPADIDRALVEVGGEHLHLGTALLHRQLLGCHHRQAIGFLAG